MDKTERGERGGGKREKGREKIVYLLYREFQYTPLDRCIQNFRPGFYRYLHFDKATACIH